MTASYDESVRSITLNADSTLAIATGAPGLPGSLTGNAVAGNQYRAIVVSGARQAGLANASASPAGVLQTKPQAAGNAATIAIGGVSKVKVSTNIVAGATVFCNTDGTGANVSANVGGVTAVLGIALDTSTVAGALVPVLLKLSE